MPEIGPDPGGRPRNGATGVDLRPRETLPRPIGPRKPAPAPPLPPDAEQERVDRLDVRLATSRRHRRERVEPGGGHPPRPRAPTVQLAVAPPHMVRTPARRTLAVLTAPRKRTAPPRRPPAGLNCHGGPDCPGLLARPDRGLPLGRRR